IKPLINLNRYRCVLAFTLPDPVAHHLKPTRTVHFVRCLPPNENSTCGISNTVPFAKGTQMRCPCRKAFRQFSRRLKQCSSEIYSGPLPCAAFFSVRHLFSVRLELVPFKEW